MEDFLGTKEITEETGVSVLENVETIAETQEEYGLSNSYFI